MTVIQDWKRDHLYENFGKKTSGKAKECFILNCLWNNLVRSGIDIEPVTQQLIRHEDGSRHFVDLYFPAIHLAIECDEAYHLSSEQKQNDEERERCILNSLSASQILTAVDVSNNQILRINAEDSLQNLYQRIEAITQFIQSSIKEEETKMKDSTAWLSPAQKLIKYQKNKSLSVGDDLTFKTINDVFHLFCPDAEAPIRKGFFRLPTTEYFMWFPQLAIERDGQVPKAQNAKGWMNFFDINNFSIIERNLNHSIFNRSNSRPQNLRLTFVKSRSILGRNSYRFAGVYKMVGQNSKEKFNQRVGTEISWSVEKQSNQLVLTYS